MLGKNFKDKSSRQEMQQLIERFLHRKDDDENDTGYNLKCKRYD